MEKYLKCSVTAMVANAMLAASTYACNQKATLGDIVKLTFLFTASHTLPAIAATVIDQHVHQNLFDNKPLQYTLTYFEAGLGTMISMSFIKNKYTKPNFFSKF